MPARPTSALGRLSVTTYLLAAFGACTLVLALLIAQTSRTSFERERADARQDLRSITRETLNQHSGAEADVEPTLAALASDPRIASLDAAQCALAFDGLRSLLVAEHAHVLLADGRELCGVSGTAVNPMPLDTTGWFDRVMAGETVRLDPAIDPSTNQPATLIAVPVRQGGEQPVGVLAAVTSTGRSEIVVPDDAPTGAVILLVDRHHDLVLAASANAPAAAGDRVGDTALSTIEPGRSLVDIDGERRIYEEVTIEPEGWHVLAGVSSEVALAPARAELQRNVLAGAVTLGIVFLLGGLLHHRLARPIQRVGRAISASLDGDTQARAPLDGPSEVTQVARVFNDLVEERQAREADLWRSARLDGLTGLPNRTALSEHLSAALEATTGDPARRVVVLFLDLDRFKHINDAYGHATGDQVLIALGDRLRATLSDAFVSRFGGDEYVIVAIGPFTSRSAAFLAEDVAQTMQRPVEIDGSALHLTGSIGIAVARDGDTAEDLIRNADTAMYRSKEQGTNGYAVFDQPMREWVMHRASIERDLHRALEGGELRLNYQPKLSLGGTGLIGFEALARWDHPTRGLVPPSEFIPIAEETGLISSIGAWALQEACAQSAAWRKLNGGLPVPVAVNLAARQLADPALPDLVAKVLERSGASARDLVLEVTESAVLFDTVGVSKRLRQLRSAGIQVSIDDFGTGYSSLGYLQQLPIDELKIDRAFVSRLPFEPSSTAIIGSIIDLAHAIGLQVVAEGVETVQQLDVLRELGCDLAQGFYIARPEPAAQATARLRQQIASRRPEVGVSLTPVAGPAGTA